MILVERISQDKIVSGSRLQYLGRRYYIEIHPDGSIQKTQVTFKCSKFEVLLNPALPDQGAGINEVFYLFYRELDRYMSDWAMLEERLCGMNLYFCGWESLMSNE